MKTTLPKELNVIIFYSLNSVSYQNIFIYRKTVLGLQNLQPEKNHAQSAGEMTKDYSHFLVLEQLTFTIKVLVSE